LKKHTINSYWLAEGKRTSMKSDMNTVLIVDDQRDVRMSAVIALGNHGFRCIEAESPEQALVHLESSGIDLMLLDMNYSADTTSGAEGLALLQRLRELEIRLPVVVMTAWASVDIAVQAMQLGACDFIEKPWKNARLLSIVKQQLSSAKLTEENARFAALNDTQSVSYLAQSPAMQALLEKARRAAASDAHILITGENGTGKSLLAQYLHQHSARAAGRFVSVNMGAIPETLFESELFGHKKGAFTDARENRLGRFDVAAGGSLFLDEIGTLPSALQAKILRVLETGEYEVLGSSQTRRANCRIISATNARLDELIASGRFRRDLLFRLNTIELQIPPLRERVEDILPLAEHLLAKHGRKYRRSNLAFSASTRATLLKHPWMGNVRELSHAVERAVILSDAAHLPPESLGLVREAGRDHEDVPLMTLEQSEQRTLVRAIKHFDGNICDAADYLGLSKSALYRRLEKFGLDPKTLTDRALAADRQAVSGEA
jgi:DNA-binding NtrC family response regulator